MDVIDLEEWPLEAKCRGMNDALFPGGKDQKRAKSVCIGCRVRAHCLAEALDNNIEWGVWGGMTERERRQLLKQRPDVESWMAVLTGLDNANEGPTIAHHPVQSTIKVRPTMKVQSTMKQVNV